MKISGLIIAGALFLTVSCKNEKDNDKVNEKSRYDCKTTTEYVYKCVPEVASQRSLEQAIELCKKRTKNINGKDRERGVRIHDCVLNSGGNCDKVLGCFEIVKVKKKSDTK